LGVILEWEEVRLLARLGGWTERKVNPPNKIVLTRGLRRLMGHENVSRILAARV
jgi:hypothetical protein